MLRDAGASMVIVGHSERRAIGETNELVRAQVVNASQAGLGVVLCVGEVERDPSGAYFSYVATQLSSALKDVSPAAHAKLVVAYEPVWAIGKSAADALQPQDVQEMIIFIRKILTEIFDRPIAATIPILYGGSVEPENAGDLMRGGGVSGFLVGHASTTLESFIGIILACKK